MKTNVLMIGLVMLTVMITAGCARTSDSKFSEIRIDIPSGELEAARSPDMIAYRESFVNKDGCRVVIDKRPGDVESYLEDVHRFVRSEPQNVTDVKEDGTGDEVTVTYTYTSQSDGVTYQLRVANKAVMCGGQMYVAEVYCPEGVVTRDARALTRTIDSFECR